MKRFATEKIAFCKPAGTPTDSAWMALSLWKRTSFKLRLQISLLRMSERTMSPADTHCENMLASATPSVDIPSPMTNTRSRMTLSTPAVERKMSGVFVSPMAFRTPLP